MKELEKFQTVEIEFKNKTFIKQNMTDTEMRNFVFDFKTKSGILTFGDYLIFKEDVLFVKLPYVLKNDK